MLCWLQRNPCHGVRCKLFERCLGSFLVSEGRHPVLPQLGEISLWQIMQCQPASLLDLISGEHKCPFAYRAAFAYSNHATSYPCECKLGNLTKAEEMSHVCLSDGCMGAACVCWKGKAHLCLCGTKICLIKSPLGTGHCLSLKYHCTNFFFLCPSSERLSVLSDSTACLSTCLNTLARRSYIYFPTIL